MAVTALAIRIDCPTVSGKHGAFQAAPPCAYFSFAPGWVGVGHTSIIAQVISHPFDRLQVWRVLAVRELRRAAGPRRRVRLCVVGEAVCGGFGEGVWSYSRPHLDRQVGLQLVHIPPRRPTRNEKYFLGLLHPCAVGDGASIGQ